MICYADEGMNADIDTIVPVTASRARLSDELGDNDIAGADAHKSTDAEMSSQSFTGIGPDSSVPCSSVASISLISLFCELHRHWAICTAYERGSDVVQTTSTDSALAWCAWLLAVLRYNDVTSKEIKLFLVCQTDMFLL